MRCLPRHPHRGLCQSPGDGAEFKASAPSLQGQVLTLKHVAG